MTADRSLAVAAVQFAPGPEPADNQAAVTAAIAREAATGARLLVFPEYSSAFDPQLSLGMTAAAQPLDGPFIAAVAAAAAAHGVFVVLGLVERVDGERERFSNTLVAVSDSGEIAAVYRKVHLYDAFGSRESERVVAGAPGAVQLVEVDGISVGMQTCYDLRFPESSRVLVDAGASLIVVPAQWVPGSGKERHWRTLLEARAIENTVHVLAADHPAPAGVGLSALYGPDGTLLAGAGSAAGVLRGLVDPLATTAVRQNNPALRLRRYGVVPRQTEASPGA